MKYTELGKGVVKRTERRVLGLFIDGTGLDRATRRINRKVDMSSLVKGVTSGIPPTIARYYTLIPYEDDSRQRAFLDAVMRAGLSVIVKRLPPKGVNRQVSVDVEMGADIVAFAMGHNSFSTLSQYQPQTESSSEHSVIEHHAQHHGPGRTLFPLGSAHRPHYRAPQRSTGSGSAKPVHDQHDSEHGDAGDHPDKDKPASSLPQNRIVTVVCPGRDLSYPISLAKELGADTVNADFGQFNTGDILKSAAKWIDLSDSETIWRD